ncbi:MAG: glycosyltransferase family 2 protein [Pirellulaceae bacterium]|nr:glycosyltransferase family 2 protein [Pirellulaceae bacterium]
MKSPRSNLLTPVVFFVFNRPEETAQVWQAIRAARPARLYVVSDAARPEVAGEAALVHACRKIAESIDWQCEVEFDYAKQNLGCGARISSGLNDVFDREERAIILEDDTVPVPTFFRFCEALLDRYENEQKVCHINGRNNLVRWDTGHSYFFSRRSNPWGWATWRRAWMSCDSPMKSLSSTEVESVTHVLNDRKHAEFIEHTVNKFVGKSIDTWDIQWSLSILRRGGFCIVPKSNLVKNIGFGPNATHTNNTENDMRAAIPVFPELEDLSHPKLVSYVPLAQKFDRLFFLFEQLNAYQKPGVMISLSRLLERQRAAGKKTANDHLSSLLPFLNPAQNPAETRELLLHLKPFIEGNPMMENLLEYF